MILGMAGRTAAQIAANPRHDTAPKRKAAKRKAAKRKAAKRKDPNDHGPVDGSAGFVWSASYRGED